MFFDSHCHLNSEELYEDIDFHIEEAKKNGVNKMMVVSYDYPSCLGMLDVLKHYKGLYGAIGIFPLEIDNFKSVDKETLQNLLLDPRIKAIGEIGLDYYWEKNESKRQEQQRVFIDQIEWANKNHLPIIVHCRDAIEDTYRILKEHKPLYGCVMHCYSGSLEMAKKFLDLGCYISLAGPVTFKNAKTPKEVASYVPLNRLLIETDSPYLTPEPHRGKMNSPKNVVLIGEYIAKIKNVSIKEVERATSRNACELFRVKQNEN